MSRQAGAVVASFLLATAAFAFSAGLLEFISFVRISSFVFPLMIANRCDRGSDGQRFTGDGTRSEVRRRKNDPAGPPDGRCVGADLRATARGTARGHRQRPSLGNRGLQHDTDAYRDQAGWPACPMPRRSTPGCTKPGKGSGQASASGAFTSRAIACYRVAMSRACSPRVCRSIAKRSVRSAGGRRSKTVRRDGSRPLLHTTRIPSRATLQCTPPSRRTPSRTIRVVSIERRKMLAILEGQAGTQRRAKRASTAPSPPTGIWPTAAMNGQFRHHRPGTERDCEGNSQQFHAAQYPEPANPEPVHKRTTADSLEDRRQARYSWRASAPAAPSPALARCSEAPRLPAASK